MSPEMELAVAVFGSMGMYHFKRKLSGSVRAGFGAAVPLCSF